MTRPGAALVTGAATGLGASFAARLARDGHELVLVDRQAERLRCRARELEERYRVRTHCIVVDLCDPAAVERVHAQTRALGLDVEVLVNNAGFHLSKLFRELPWPEVHDNLRVLLDVVVEMTHRFVPDMAARGRGRVINVSSVSGFMPGGRRLATYTASKGFLIPFSEALNFELEGTGVSVTVVCPGFTRTDFYENSGLTDVRDSVPWFMWRDPDAVVDEAMRAVSLGKPVRVCGLPNRLIVTATKVTPRVLLRQRTRVLHAAMHAASRTKNGGRTERAARNAALVTGASSGIGASFAELLAREGYDLLLVARRRSLLEQRAADLAGRFGVRAHALALDLTDPRAVDAILDERNRLGWPIDVAVNSAGYPVNDLFNSMSWRDVDAALQILVRSPARLTHELLPGMIERGWGRVINVASLAGFEPGSYRSTLYSSSKAFLISFSESVDAELEGTGVHVTALCPGFTNTEWASKTGLGTGGVPSVLRMESADVARIGLAAALRGTAVSVVGTPPQRLISAIFGMAPRHTIGRLLSKKRRSMLAAKVAGT